MASCSRSRRCRTCHLLSVLRCAAQLVPLRDAFPNRVAVLTCEELEDAKIELPHLHHHAPHPTQGCLNQSPLD
jgi:hypothetical protein